jgi:hypothetical protein
MKDVILRFLNGLDEALVPHAGGEQLTLYHIGRSSLVWKYGFATATADVDVVHPNGTVRLLGIALQLFGKGTAKAREHGLYLEQVPPGLPPIWWGCRNRATEVVENWKVIRLYHLDAHDMVITKLKRFSIKDQEDIGQLCDLGVVDMETLRTRLNGAYPFAHEKDEDPGREAAFENIEKVIRYLESGDWS